MSISVGAGISLGPGITLTSLPDLTAGQILNLDAGDPASYSGTGTTWLDISGAGNNTSLIGFTPWISAGSASYFTFNIGQGYAQGGYILPNTTYTKVAIFRIFGSFLNLISGDNLNQHAFWGAGTQYLQAGHNGAWSTIQSPLPTPVGQWVFGAVSFSYLTGWQLYLNGFLVSTNPDNTQFLANPAQIQVGAYDGNNNNLNGDMAVSLIYDRVLSDSEITALYHSYKSRFGLP